MEKRSSTFIVALIWFFRLKLWLTIILAWISVFLILSMLGQPLNYSLPVDLPVRVDLEAGHPGDGLTGGSLRLIEFTQSRLLVPLGEIGLAERVCLFASLVFDALWTYLILRFLGDLRQGRPFLFRNAIRVRWVGVSVIASGISRQLGAGLLAHRCAQSLVIPSARVVAEPDPELGFLLLGVLIILCAELFRLGAQLQQEQDLTV